MAADAPRILILKPSSLGDIVHTLPAVAALRKHWPKSEISWLINPEWAPLLAENPDVDRVIEFPRKQFRGISGMLKVPRWLHSLQIDPPDLALDFQGLLRTALIARFLKARRIVGLADAREGAGFFYDEKVVLSEKGLHSVDRYLELASALGAAKRGSPEFSLPPGKRPLGEIPENYILLHPFSRGAGKSLGESEVMALCRALAPKPVLLVGGPGEIEKLPENVGNLLGKTSLLELIWLIRQADFTISVDSGPMHIAAAITAKVLSIHTWSDPRLVGPYRSEAWIWKDGIFCRMADFQPATASDPAPPEAEQILEFLVNQKIALS